MCQSRDDIGRYATFMVVIRMAADETIDSLADDLTEVLGNAEYSASITPVEEQDTRP